MLPEYELRANADHSHTGDGTRRTKTAPLWPLWPPARLQATRSSRAWTSSSRTLAVFPKSGHFIELVLVELLKRVAHGRGLIQDGDTRNFVVRTVVCVQAAHGEDVPSGAPPHGKAAPAELFDGRRKNMDPTCLGLEVAPPASYRMRGGGADGRDAARTWTVRGGHG